jgi:hypothetical protein
MGNPASQAPKIRLKELVRNSYLSLLLLGCCPPLASAPPEDAPIQFREVAARAGLDFTLENHASENKHYIETMPGGVAVFDYNGDGLADIYFTNGAAIPALRKTEAKYSNRLFRNEGGMKFKDVTTEAGVAGEGYSIGAAAADYDNDGDADLFVAGVNRNILYRNKGKGQFEDVTATSGIRSGRWAVAGGWLDYDNDGRLDLFVVNYVQWSAEKERFCGDPGRGLRVYCHPKYYSELANTLYRNRGDGTFEDVSAKSGIAKVTGKGMAVAIADYNLDGFQDVFVTNDYVSNYLFRNRSDGTFEETGLLAGVGLRDNGQYISNMGADFRDYDNDGLPDIMVVALAGQSFPLFRNLGRGTFRDATQASGLARLSLKQSGWSPLLADFDNDGWKDLFVSSAHVNDRIEMFETNRYRLHNAIFLNAGNGTFQDVSAGAGLHTVPERAHRGAAVADFNNDGRLDVVVSALGGRAELWENVSPGENHWLRLRLVGTHSSRDGIGARVRIGNQHNHMTTSYGYSSSSLQGVHFGLGKQTAVERIEIVWPSRARQVLEDVAANQEVNVREPE